MMQYLNLAKMALYTILQKISQLLFDIIFGPRSADKSGYKVLCYEVVWDWKIMPFQKPGPELFTLKFLGVKDIHCIEQRHVSLYAVREKDFLFVRTASDKDIYDMSRHPFLYTAKQSHARDLMVVSRDMVYDYVRGSDMAERDGSNIAFLHSIGRCGSTLLTNMVYKTRQCRVLSEPWPLLDVLGMISKDGVPEPVEWHCELLRVTLLLLTLDSNRKYFIKTHSMVIFLLPLFKKVLPGIKEIFMFRAIRPTITSFKKAFLMDLPFSVIEDSVLKHVPKQFLETWQENRVMETEHCALFYLLSHVHMFISETADRTDMRSYSYESLLADKHKFCETFLRDIGVGEEFVEIALTAMDQDSQGNSAIGRKQLEDKKNTKEVSEATLQWAAAVGEKMGIQLEGADYQFQNMPHQWNRLLEEPISY